jgi:chorismate mutase
MGSTTAALVALRETLAESEEPILRALRFRIGLPFNGRLYARIPLLGMSRFDVNLYLNELGRALSGSYKHGERPLSTVWLPNTNIPTLDVTRDIREGYVRILQQLCPAGDQPKTYANASRGDLDALWFLSKRIHEAGISVGERKLSDADPETLARYKAEAQQQAVESLIALLKDEEQEGNVIQRIRWKASTIKFDPDIAEKLFRELVFPNTLKLEAQVIISACRPT